MDTKDWWESHAKAKEELAKIPGVVGVGLGIKEVKGQLTGEVALIIYVREKMPSDRISQGDIIPAEFQGMMTDVQRYPQVEFFGSTTLQGGHQIRRLPDKKGSPKPGTLGYIATRIDNDRNVMLSCEHVLEFRKKDERLVFHPDVSPCCGKLKNKVGRVIFGKAANVPFNNGTFADDFFVDAATALIDFGTNARKHVPRVGQIVGPKDISASPVGPGDPIISVKKFGAATKFTEGVVVDVAFTHERALRTIRIRPTVGFPLKIRWKVPEEDVAEHLTNFPARSAGGTATQVSADEIDFSVNTFTSPGDSGAVVVDSSGGVVGMIVGGSVYQLEAFQGGKLGLGIVPTGFGIACHIGPVLQEMGVRIDPSTEPTAGESMIVPGDEITVAPASVQQINARIDSLEEQLAQTPSGRRLTELVRKHAEEVMGLVHERRKVLVAWHRSQGPAFANLFVRAITDPDGDLPREVNGTTLQAARERMCEVLMAEGSSALRETLTANRELVRQLVDSSRSINELVERTTELPVERWLPDVATTTADQQPGDMSPNQ
jgi:hypothetical protein